MTCAATIPSSSGNLRRRLVLAACVALASACTDPAPPIADGLSKTFAPSSPEFNSRIEQRFPVGSSEDALLSELRTQHFVIVDDDRQRSSGGGHSAVYELKDMACKQTWTVVWQSADKKITQISGDYRQVCF